MGEMSYDACAESDSEESFSTAVVVFGELPVCLARGGLAEKIDGASHPEPSTVQDMGIDHRSAHAPVTQQLLNRAADVIAGGQQVRGKAMSKGRTLFKCFVRSAASLLGNIIKRSGAGPVPAGGQETADSGRRGAVLGSHSTRSARISRPPWNSTRAVAWPSGRGSNSISAGTTL